MRLLSTNRLRLVLAVLLIFTPLWGPFLGLTTPRYTYEAGELTSEDNRLVVPDRDDRNALSSRGGLSGFACLYTVRPSRHCTLEAATLDGTITIDHPTVTSSSTGYLVSRAPYLSYDGVVYAYNSTWDAGKYVLSTERVSAATALDDVSRPAERYPTVLTAIQTGSAHSKTELWSERDGVPVFELDGEYYVVYQSGSRQPLPSNPAAESFLTWVAVVLGSAILFGRDADNE
ncbi:hypothetical protein C440_16239 [Haloferax mucosum ATCC BAA-1512]|uniref:Uncharacterized protein n=1 Tax=Haloferax mucosum ATCC BAA-1512 TaxID=662479 RepID=M0I7P3_9EURY|nr:hypothetical protein [Haloferax mucosum]ELZ91878.1 hypothetical protein C440_16239 [Haloferax mucosum ATCC BAA-1512]